MTESRYDNSTWVDMKSATRTQRGFAKVEIPDTHGCIVRLQRSSSAEEACVWIFTDDPKGIYADGKPAPHLNAEQARQVAEVLIAFADQEDYDART